MSTADIQLSVVFGGQYSFEKLQSDYEQTNPLERDFIKNLPDLVNFEAETVTTETVIFEENPTGAIAPLKLQYNPTEKTIEFGLKDGGVLQLGKEMFEEYTNIDTVALTNGMIVSTAAISGNRKGIKRTDFTSLTSIRSIVGMVTVASIGTNQSGRVTTKGIVNELNTDGIGEGSQLWGNPSVLGGWSGSKPAKPQYAVQIGQVVVASATVGSVELNIAKDVKFSDLADVNGTTSAIDNTDTIPKRDADGIIREISVADIKADFKADTDLIYEPLLGFTPENTANKGQANGYASLGADGLVPSNQLPSFVDDVLEFANLAAFPAVGETGKIYVALDTNKTYRWSGSTYIYITSGAVDSVAGKTGVVTLVKADVGLSNVDNTSDVSKPVSTLQAAAIATKVGLTDNETVAGVKTFSSSPIVPNPTTAGQALNKGTADSSYVALTGAQNVAGVKTFTDSPIVPTPVNDNDAANKAYVDTVVVTQANVEQVRSQATNKVASSKLLDDELKLIEEKINTIEYNVELHHGILEDLEIESYQLFKRMSDFEIPNPTRKSYINRLISAGKLHGWWDKADNFKIYAAHNRDCALLNWKSVNNNSLEIGSLTFTPDKGFKSDGTASNYLDLNFTPSEHGANYSKDSASFIVSINDDNKLGVNNLGCGSNIGANTYLIFSTAQNTGYKQTRGAINSAGTLSNREFSFSTKGFHSINRISASQLKVGKNYGQTANNISSTAINTGTMALCGIKTSTSIIYSNSFEYSFSFIGAGLSDTEYYNLIKDVSQYMYSIGNDLTVHETSASIFENPVCDIITGQSNVVSLAGTILNLPSEDLGIKSNKFIYDVFRGTVSKLNSPYNTSSIYYSALRWGQEIPFFKKTVLNTSAPATIIKISNAGVDIANWASPSGYIWVQFVTAVNDYINYCTIHNITPVFRSVLWGQGENDCTVSKIPNYEAALINVINNIRTINPLLSNVKIIIMKLNEGFTGLILSDIQAINAIYDNIAETISNVDVIDVNSMSLTFADSLHYDINSIVAIGDQYGGMVNI